jgi:transcription-repair coupling factor (superfamily II helicase)
MLSRLRPAAEREAVKEGLAAGTIDIVVGTHALLGKDVRFKNLGLLIVDEEQRFGVAHKERLKQLRTTVDVLTMSATPIPRTLEMSLTGIREMSTILTPPEERHPVLTFVGPYDEKQISAAIRRELMREGQVFFLHNRVESIDRVAKRLRELVPEARVATGHGQMTEEALEQVMVGFWERRFARSARAPSAGRPRRRGPEPRSGGAGRSTSRSSRRGRCAGPPRRAARREPPPPRGARTSS